MTTKELQARIPRSGEFFQRRAKMQFHQKDRPFDFDEEPDHALFKIDFFEWPEKGGTRNSAGEIIPVCVRSMVCFRWLLRETVEDTVENGDAADYWRIA
jgi:hypothetical protein